MSKSGLGNRLACIRKKHRLTQDKMAKRLNISRSAYQYYERGERDVSASVLAKIYQEFEVEPLWLMAGDDGDGGYRKWITGAYRDIGIVVDTRVLEICPDISCEKKWAAIDFLFDEFCSFDSWKPEYQEPPVKKIDKVLRLMA